MSDPGTITAYDRHGKIYTLTSTGSRGGEGQLYLVENEPAICAKIYKPKCRTRGRFTKVTSWIAMYQNGTIDDAFAAQAVIPGACLFSSSDPNLDTFIGFTMDRLDGPFYNPVDFGSADPSEIDYREKIAAAKNIAIVTNTVHAHNIVIGDYNNNNIAVFRGGLLKLMDCDSVQFQIRQSGRRIFLPCLGLFPEYRPPEVRGVDLGKQIDPDKPYLNTYTDLWQMGIHIFRLLMNGASPFSGASLCPEADNNAGKDQHTFIYAAQISDAKRVPPPYAPVYSMLSDELRRLFERCFVEGSIRPEMRPGPEEYYSALCNYEQTLRMRPCGHMMPAGSHSCEWCRLRKEGYTHELSK